MQPRAIRLAPRRTAVNTDAGISKQDFQELVQLLQGVNGNKLAGEHTGKSSRETKLHFKKQNQGNSKVEHMTFKDRQKLNSKL